MVKNITENLEPKEELEQQETVEVQNAVVEETISPKEETTEVIEEIVAPVEEAAELVEEAIAPVDEITEVIEEIVAPVEEVNEVVEEVIAPVDEIVAPTEIPAEDEPIAPEAELIEEFVEPVVIPVVKKTKTAKPVAVEPAAFDWDALEEEDKGFSGRTKNEMGSLYEKTLTTVQEKEVVEGKVISMNKREVVIDIGYKSDGIVSLNEFRYNPELKPKDLVEVYIESLEDLKGQMILSHKKARALRSWDRVNEALEKDEVIKGYIKCRTKGGMIRN